MLLLTLSTLLGLIHLCVATLVTDGSTLSTRGPACSPSAANVQLIKGYLRAPLYFCNWWDNASRSRTPFPALSIEATTKVCNCIKQKPEVLGQKYVGRPKDHVATTNAGLNKLLINLGQPLAFCQFWLSR